MHKKSPLYIVLMLMLVATTVNAIEITQTKTDPSDTIQGGTIDLCIDVVENNPQAQVMAVLPNGQIRTYEMEQHEIPICLDNVTGIELFYRFQDTQRTGTYNLTYTATKGGDTATTKDQFEVVPISVVVDYVGSVGNVATVDSCKAVEKVLEPSIEVFGTEYIPFQLGKVWLQLLNENGTEPINDAICYVHIYTPSNQIYVEKSKMNYLEDGIYYYDLLTPSGQGVYPVLAECYFTATQEYEYADSFWRTIGTDFSGSYTNTHTLDDLTHTIREDVYGGQRRFEIGYNFTDMCGTNISEALLTGLTIDWVGNWNSLTNDKAIFSIYNFTSGQWIEMGNQLSPSPSKQGISNSLLTNNLTKSGVVSNQELRLKIMDTDISDTSASQFQTDLLSVSCDQLSNSEWQLIRGASEIHITSDKYWTIDLSTITADITQEAYIDTFYINFTLSSLTSVTQQDEIINYDVPLPFPCHYITNVSVNANITDWFPQNPVESPITKGCSVSWVMDLEPNTNYNIQIISRNWFKIQEDNWATQMYLLNDYLQLVCIDYQNATNKIPYKKELNSTPFQQVDSFYDACQQYISIFNYWNTTFMAPLTPETYGLTYYDMQGLDEEWRHLIKLREETQAISNTIIQGLLLGASYSGGIMSNQTILSFPDYATYWANSSQSFNNYLGISYLPFNNWNYPTRNLTYYPPASVNNTAVAEEVWNWNNIGNRIITWLDETINAVIQHVTI